MSYKQRISFKVGGIWRRLTAQHVGDDLDAMTMECGRCKTSRCEVVCDVMQLGFWKDTGVLVTYCAECDKYRGFVYTIDTVDNIDRQVADGVKEMEEHGN
jgi:hypothetical protein